MMMNGKSVIIKRENGAGGWRRLYNEEFRDFYKVQEDKMGRICRTHVRHEKRIQNFGRKT